MLPNHENCSSLKRIGSSGCVMDFIVIAGKTMPIPDINNGNDAAKQINI